MVWSYDKFKSEIQSNLNEREIHDPQNISLPPYYPDTPIVRKTVARFYDCVTAMDKEVGEILKNLEEDGLAENTIVFFFSDHGSGMPRHKRVLCLTVVCMSPSWFDCPKNGSILPHFNRVKK